MQLERIHAALYYTFFTVTLCPPSTETKTLMNIANSMSLMRSKGCVSSYIKITIIFVFFFFI